MNHYKAIISDIDGTLTPMIPHALPTEKVSQAIRDVIQHGTIFGLASGRPYILLDYLIKHLGLTAPSITDNGAAIIDSQNQSVLWEALLSHTEAQTILGMTQDFKLTRLSSDIANLENPLKIPKHGKIRKISIHGLTPSVADTFISQIQLTMKDLTLVKAAAYEGDEFVDVYISNAMATKQHAVLEWARIQDISTDEIVGIGDGYNDFPLLMACGLKIAMGNAVPELKAIADEIAPPLESDGLAYILEKYFLS